MFTLLLFIEKNMYLPEEYPLEIEHVSSLVALFPKVVGPDFNGDAEKTVSDSTFRK